MTRVRKAALWSVAALALLAVLGLAGCGGGSSAAEGKQGVASSKREFQEKANAICNRTKKYAFHAMIAYLQQHRSSDKPEAQRLAEAQSAAYPPRIKKQIGAILALDPPDGEAWQVKAFVVALREGIYSEHVNSPAPKLFSEAFAHSNRIAGELGIKTCIFK